MAISEQSKKAFIGFINELIEKFATAVFEESQVRVPRVSSDLANSGTIRKTFNGMEIEYSALYSSLIDGHGQDSTMITRDGKSFRFPKSPAQASGFVSQTVEELGETMLPQLIIEANGGAASREYDFYIQ